MVTFPATAAGTVGRVIASGALGVGVAVGWGHLPAPLRQPPRRIAMAIVLAVVALFGITVFWDLLTTSPDWQMGDWGPQQAVLAHVMPSLPGLDVPVWNHVVSTGDAPLELYPALTYLFTGHVAWLLGLEHDLPQAFMIVATLVHVGLALTTTAVAMRIAGKPVALVVGLLFLVDGGAISHGGTVGLFHWALLHSAFAHVFSMIAALGILAALKQPRIGASVAIWLGTAVATAAHPAALITAAACALGLAGVSLLAGDVPPRRALAALGHLALGVALGATVWLPASERLLAYGQHFSNELFPPVKVLEMVFQFAMPITTYSFVVYAGYLGILVGMWTRRAEVIFVAIVGLVMLVGIADGPYLAFHFTPGQTVARLGAIRMMMLARPFVFATAAFAVTALVARARESWVGATPRARLVAAAVLGVMTVSVVRLVPDFWRDQTDRAIEEGRQYAPDIAGRAQLEAWAVEQAAQLGPQKWARALFEEDTHEHMRLTAETGLPTFHLAPLPDNLLRERIEDASAPSLVRFDVRWVIALGRSPTLGDAASERVLGTYHVRELSSWDGKFARIERGTGTVTTTRLDDHAVEIEVTASGPVLVALGTGYYPRWRATHATGADEPVYALRSTPTGTLHVVAAWVAPGRTTFTCDGPLPSDGDGRVLSLLAALAALAGVVVWRRTRWRLRALRRLAWLRSRTPAVAGWLLEFGVPALLSVLLVRGCATELGRTQAVLVGSGVRADATVEAREPGGDWQTCGYSTVSGSFHCDDLVTVSDATVNMLNDAPPSWPFITPSIAATSERGALEIRVTRTVKLAGRYWAGVSSGTARLEVEGQPTREIGAHSVQEFDDGGRRTMVLTAQVPESGTLQISIVAEDTLIPARPFLEPPPDEPPAGVTAIGR